MGATPLACRSGSPCTTFHQNSLSLGHGLDRIQRHRVVRRHHWISGEQRDRLANSARRHGVTLSMVFAAAFAEVLATWSESPQFLLNMPLFDRDGRFLPEFAPELAPAS